MSATAEQDVTALEPWAGPPFIVYALPRSRTAWLSRYLSYGGWRCHHEAAPLMRAVEDIGVFFRQPHTGTVETAAAPGWRIIRHHVPEARSAVIRRPVSDVVQSVLHMDTGGVGFYDEASVTKLMIRERRDLDRISAQPGVLTIDYADLSREDACAAIFEHCLPYQFDRAWWAELEGQNLQANIPEKLLYYYQHRDEIERFKGLCKSELRRIAEDAPAVAEAVT